MSSEDSGGAGRVEKNILDLLPSDWLPADGDGLAVAYRILGIARASVIPPSAVELDDVCVLIALLELPQLTVQSTLTPLQDGEDGLDGARDRIHRTVGLLSAAAGKLLVYEHVEDYRVSFVTGMLNAVSTLVADTTWWDSLEIASPKSSQPSHVGRILLGDEFDDPTSIDAGAGWLRRRQEVRPAGAPRPRCSLCRFSSGHDSASLLDQQAAQRAEAERQEMTEIVLSSVASTPAPPQAATSPPAALPLRVRPPLQVRPLCYLVLQCPAKEECRCHRPSARGRFPHGSLRRWLRCSMLRVFVLASRRRGWRSA
jgi:hypothetical protein